MKREFINSMVLSFSLLALLHGLAGCSRDPSPMDEVKPFSRLLEEQSIQSKILNRPVTYAVILPEEYEATDDPFPVVYLLHGYGESETGWYKGGNIRYYLDQFASETIPMIYVMPEGFNTYYVDKYNGNYPYMSMLVNELVPAIDSLFRTVPDAGHRAVMGYSMGGYGAMILPVKNPDLFKTGVALSMSFRNDRQYLAEPQGVFDQQWGTVFGGIGATGEQRLTGYFKDFSPFHFLLEPGSNSMEGINLFLDCGDDEESLSETNNDLHVLLRDRGITHEYRVRNGGHTWDYWHHALPEALKYIAFAVQQTPYSAEPDPIGALPAIPAERLTTEFIQGAGLTVNVLLPPDYSNGTTTYPVIIVLHDRTGEAEPRQLISLMNSNIASFRLPPSVVVEVPVADQSLTSQGMQDILEVIHSNYRIFQDKEHTVMIGNGQAGEVAFALSHDFSLSINSFLLFDASLPQDAIPEEGVSYYLDICDKGINYRNYHPFFLQLKEKGIPFEYRVRNGSASYDSFLHGLDQASQFIKDQLKSQAP